ncbi:hypothetical protein BH09PSE4_BH09PSE4_05850 [soil metagenome]
MLTPHYEIEVDPRLSLLHITLGGFFSLTDVDRLITDRNIAMKRLTCGPNQHVTLVDVSGCKLQSQDVVGAFMKAIVDPRSLSRRLAFVTESSLARMQVRRMVTREGTALFENVSDAKAWLLTGDVVAQAMTG